MPDTNAAASVPNQRVTVKAGQYRGLAGFKITASNGPGAWPQRIFCRTEQGALEIKAAIRAQSRLARNDSGYSSFDTIISNVLRAGR